MGCKIDRMLRVQRVQAQCVCRPIIQIFHPCLLLSSSTGYQIFKHVCACRLKQQCCANSVFFHFESNRIVELLFEISNHIKQLSLVSKVTICKYLLNKFSCFYGTALLWLQEFQYLVGHNGPIIKTSGPGPLLTTDFVGCQAWLLR